MIRDAFITLATEPGHPSGRDIEHRAVISDFLLRLEDEIAENLSPPTPPPRPRRSAGGVPVFALALVPASPPDVVAWLGMGGFNACPLPEEISAVLRSWLKDYGAVPVAIASNSMEVQFRSLPPGRQHLANLAHEFCTLCSDLLMASPDNALSLVRALAQEEAFVHFWWDWSGRGAQEGRCGGHAETGAFDRHAEMSEMHWVEGPVTHAGGCGHPCPSIPQSRDRRRQWSAYVTWPVAET